MDYNKEQESKELKNLYKSKANLYKYIAKLLIQGDEIEERIKIIEAGQKSMEDKPKQEVIK